MTVRLIGPRARRWIGSLVLFLVTLGMAGGAAAQPSVWYYAVQEGENPWSITRRYFKDGLRYWQPLVERNGIERPRFIPPGTVVAIPASWLRVVPSRATVEAVRGQVSIVDEGVRRAAASGADLAGGERVVTGDRSSALIRFANGTKLLVTQSSEVALDRLSGFDNTLMVDASVRLLRGRIEAETGSGGSLDSLDVRSPVALSAVRGTSFRIGADAERDRLEVLEGRVDIQAQGVTRRIGSGRGTLARAGAAPEPQRRLLPPPELAGAGALLERLPLQLQVVPNADAVAYRVQVAPTNAFDVLLVDALAPGPGLRIGDLDDGTYALRLRAVDRDGIEGRDLDTLLEIDARPAPPLLIEPPADGRSRVQPPRFRWAEVEGASGYRFRLEPGLTRGFMVDLAAEGGFVAPADLPVGTHRWRVATIDAAGERGPFSDLQVFEQLDPPPVIDGAPELEAADEPTVRWPDAGPGYRYRVQIARDGAFEDVVLDEVVEANTAAFDAAAGSAVFIRVAVIEPDGFEGPFGAVNRVDVPASRWWPLVLAPFLLLLLL